MLFSFWVDTIRPAANPEVFYFATCVWSRGVEPSGLRYDTTATVGCLFRFLVYGTAAEQVRCAHVLTGRLLLYIIRIEAVLKLSSPGVPIGSQQCMPTFTSHDARSHALGVGLERSTPSSWLIYSSVKAGRQEHRLFAACSRVCQAIAITQS